jgi:hypothetical protein
MEEATGSKVVGVEDDRDQRKEWDTCPGVGHNKFLAIS